MPNMVHELVGQDLFIVVHRAVAPTDDEWNAYLADWKGVDMTRAKTLVFTDGGSPNSIQRGAVNDILRGEPSLTAVVTPSAFVRGVVTALSWFNSKIRTFAPRDTQRAFEYLGVRSEAEIDHLWRVVGKLRTRLGDDSLKSIAAERAV